MILTRDADGYTLVEWRRHGPHTIVVRQKQSSALMAYGEYRKGSGVELKVLVEPEEMHPKRVEAVYEAAMQLQHEAADKIAAEEYPRILAAHRAAGDITDEEYQKLIDHHRETGEMVW